MEKGNILTNARSFARQMCPASHLLQSLETNAYHLFPSDNRSQQVLGKQEMDLHLHTSGRRLGSQGQSRCPNRPDHQLL